MGENDDIIKEFLVESYENLDRLDQDLVQMERDPSKDLLDRIFRSTHTIKGTCGFFGYSKLQEVGHSGENLLSLLRDGKLSLTPEITSALLAMVDAIRQILGSIEKTGKEGEADYSVVVETLNRLKDSSPSKPPPPESKNPPSDTPPSSEEEPTPKSSSSEPNPTQTPSPPSTQEQGEKESEAHKVDTIIEAAELHTTSSISETHIRVDVGLLDKLMILVGELVLSRNQVLQFLSTQENQALAKNTQRLNMITSELQENVMRTRMQPIGKVWNKFPRVIRDLAMTCGKKVNVEMEGEGTELDKTLLEAITDPLTHAVRNAVDHGIEMPEERQARQKPPQGKLLLRASHESGHVNIDIIDDGAGIDVEKIKEKALNLGLLTEEQIKSLNNRDATNLIFMPGFSTAEKVTNLSGRGVGMDVVKSNIERIGGTIDIMSKEGKGTTLKIKIPLTLAIIPALIVTSNKERFAIPQVSLLELLRLNSDEAQKNIESIKGVPVYRLRGTLLPLVDLKKELFPNQEEKNKQDDSSGKTTIVVLQAGDHQFGLIVDGLNDSEEIVVKPLGQQLKGVPVYAGATIMGDGKVALILDVLGMALRAHVLSEIGDKLTIEKKVEKIDKEVKGNQETLLLFKSPDGGQMAIPLSKVARLDEISRSQIEKAGPMDVVQYRDEILPLIYLSESIEERRKRPRSKQQENPSLPQDTIQLILYTHENKSVGLVVEQILDILENRIELQSPGTRHGVLGTAVLNGNITELLDLEAIVRNTYPQFYEKPKETETSHG